MLEPRHNPPMNAGTHLPSSCGGHVVLVAINGGYFDFFLNWFLFSSRFVDAHCMIAVAEDAEAFRLLHQCRKIPKSNIRFDAHAASIAQNSTDSGMIRDSHATQSPDGNDTTAHFGSDAFLRFTARRPHHVLHWLRTGVGVLYSDTDIVWLKDPWPHLNRTHEDLAVMDDTLKAKSHFHAGTGALCSCMFYLAPTNNSINFAQSWIHEIATHKDVDDSDQKGFNRAVVTGTKARTLRMHLLRRDFFPSGNVYFGTNSFPPPGLTGPSVAFVVHANFVVGAISKFRLLREVGLWCLAWTYAQRPAKWADVPEFFVDSQCVPNATSHAPWVWEKGKLSGEASRRPSRVR